MARPGLPNNSGKKKSYTVSGVKRKAQESDERSSGGGQKPPAATSTGCATMLVSGFLVLAFMVCVGLLL